MPKLLEGHHGVVSSLAVSVKSNFIVTGSFRHQGAESEVRIWDVSSGNEVGQIKTGLNSVFSIAMSPDGSSFVVGGGGVVLNNKWIYTTGVEVWELTGKQRKIGEFGRDLFFVKSIEFAPDGKSVLTTNLKTPKVQGTDDPRRVRVWRTSNFKATSIFGEHPTGISSASFSRDGKLIVYASNAGGGVKRPQVFDSNPLLSRLLQKARTEAIVHEVSSMTPTIHFWDTLTNTEEVVLELPRGRIERIAFSLDGSLLASSGSTLAVWNVNSRQIVQKIEQGSTSYSNCVAFSPDGQILASGGGYQHQPGSAYEDCGVKLWDTRDWRFMALFPHRRPVYSLAFSPDGRKLWAGGEGGELQMWTVDSASAVHLKEASG